jgi:hypothetical protein
MGWHVYQLLPIQALNKESYGFTNLNPVYMCISKRCIINRLVMHKDIHLYPMYMHEQDKTYKKHKKVS